MVDLTGNVNSQSGHRYISPERGGRTYRISIDVKGHKRFVARRKDLEEAIRLRDEKLKEYGLL
jgi:hypothetical protein